MKISKNEKATLNALMRELMFLRDGAKCMKCNRPSQMSHIYQKGRYSKMEWEPLNVIPLCVYHHLFWWHKNDPECWPWLESVLPKKQLDFLKLRAQVTGSGSRDYKLLKLMLKQELCKFKLN